MNGDPRVIERNGATVVVDATGAELVCRRLSPYAHGTYHRINCTRYERAGTVRPACRVTGVNDDNWRLVARTAIEDTWDGCTYQACYGADDHRQQSTGSQLRTKLADMSVEEFDAAVAAHQTVRTDGGEH